MTKTHKIVLNKDWIEARRKFLTKEKEFLDGMIRRA